MPAWMRKKSEPKKVETPIPESTTNDSNKTSQTSTQSNLFQNQQASNKVIEGYFHLSDLPSNRR